MSIWVSLFIADFINNFACAYLCGSSLKRNNKNKLIYIGYILILSILSVFLIQNAPSAIRMIGKFSAMVIIFYLLFKGKLSSTIITTFIIYLVFAISEIILALFFFSILGANAEFLSKNEFGILIINIGILILSLLIFNNKRVNKLFSTIISWYEEKNTLNLILLTIYSIITIYVLMTHVSNGISNSPLFFVCSLFSVSIIIFITISFKANADRNKVIKEYDTLMNYVDDYEHIMDNQRKNQHEYKNQLIIIQDLISNRNVKAKNYIKSLLKESENDKNSIYVINLSKISLSGIKGLLYYKLNQMIRQGIEVYVNVECENGQSEIWDICENNLKDLSRILGVYLDNAKEAASLADKKYVIIDIIQTTSNLIFCISNTYLGSIEFTRIDEERYSTKGKNRGYGLSLVKEIIEHNQSFTQEREFNGIYFVQKLIVNKK